MRSTNAGISDRLRLIDDVCAISSLQLVVTGDYTPAWHGTLRTLLRHAQVEGAVDTSLDPDATAALVTASVRGIFMLPPNTTSPQRIEQMLTQLERLLGVKARGKKS
jgi:hypothetical protein